MATQSDITIKRATIADVLRVAPLFDAYRQFYGKPSDLKSASEFLRSRLFDCETVVYYATGENEHVAGFAQLFPSFSSVSLCRAWILNDLFVHPDFRARGVGHALMERAKQHCLEFGARQLWLQTDLTNDTAQRLYETVGMTRKEILEYTWTP